MLPLNEIEHEIMTLVCKGKSNDDVAQIIGRSRPAVQAILRVAYPKLDAHNRAEACANFVKRTLK